MFIVDSAINTGRWSFGKKIYSHLNKNTNAQTSDFKICLRGNIYFKWWFFSNFSDDWLVGERRRGSIFVSLYVKLIILTNWTLKNRLEAVILWIRTHLFWIPIRLSKELNPDLDPTWLSKSHWSGFGSDPKFRRTSDFKGLLTS
jgi:hypothetical protein